MAHFGFGVEQALHYLFQLGSAGPAMPSARDIADFYGLSPSAAAKLFTRLEKAGIVSANEGREGGFRLARTLSQINVLEVVDAVEGRKRLFDCKEIRANCVVFDQKTPDWAANGVCAIHAVMLEAEQTMRRSLMAVTLEDIKDKAAGTIPDEFSRQGARWFRDRRSQRRNTGKRKQADG